MLYDVAVVGGGPAGLSAATWAARYRRSVLIVDSGEYRNRWVHRSHGYLGNDPADPMELLRPRLPESALSGPKDGWCSACPKA